MGEFWLHSSAISYLITIKGKVLSSSVSLGFRWLLHKTKELDKVNWKVPASLQFWESGRGLSAQHYRAWYITEALCPQTSLALVLVTAWVLKERTSVPTCNSHLRESLFSVSPTKCFTTALLLLFQVPIPATSPHTALHTVIPKFSSSSFMQASVPLYILSPLQELHSPALLHWILQSSLSFRSSSKVSPFNFLMLPPSFSPSLGPNGIIYSFICAPRALWPHLK